MSYKKLYTKYATLVTSSSIEYLAGDPVLSNYKLTLTFLSLTVATAVSATATTRYVNNDSAAGSTCPSQYTTIQAAVTASSSGDEVYVCNGIYNEQVTISMPLTLSGQSGAELQPSNVTAPITDFDSGQPIAAILAVTGTTGVVINDLIIDGTNNGISGGCGTDLVGILVQNANVTIYDSTVRYVELSPSLFGCQQGLAIYAETASGLASSLTVEQTVVHDYDKNGITADDMGTTAILKANYITGIGPTPLIAQNGIQIAYGATATITGNVVSGNVYSSCTVASEPCYSAEDVLVYQSSNVTVENNDLGLSQTAVDIDQDSNNCTVSGNRVSNTLVYDGIYLSGDNNTVSSNVITNSAESGVNIVGMGNTIKTNTII